MPQEITIAAVGDILMSTSLIESSKRDSDMYDFSSIFRHVAPMLQQADLTIGNLEIPLAGREKRYTKKNHRTGFYMFNCPDELAQALKDTGFDVLTTANNHCMDRGIKGLNRTLVVLDQLGIAHTGTYRTKEDAQQFTIQEVEGIKVGILAYSKSTNKIPVPSHQTWCINLTDERKMLSDLKELKKHVDLAVVCVHFGVEYKHMPSLKQKRIVHSLLAAGADIILGSHPHVIQPAVYLENKQFVVYSMGNFISTTLNNNPYTRNGVIVQLRVTKDEDGRITIAEPEFTPTRVCKQVVTKGRRYQVVPIPQVGIARQAGKKGEELRSAAKHTLRMLRSEVE
ncbi:CapA family protein [Paenibacillus cremeus]|uniref:CapA family protein n=1 Tax=Paenibacillus cremeus TaxID=2163881 RepID=A0A559K554_9BACL|nr:CapA family protein [Paenibacillus cremeus]TVY07281.1 CapA family protein [Paenibacillus cremeus]